MIREKDIVHENGKFWVLKKCGVFYVMASVGTHSVSDSCYHTADLAVCRCDYLARRQGSKMKRLTVIIGDSTRLEYDPMVVQVNAESVSGAVSEIQRAYVESDNPDFDAATDDPAAYWKDNGAFVMAVIPAGVDVHWLGGDAAPENLWRALRQVLRGE